MAGNVGPAFVHRSFEAGKTEGRVYTRRDLKLVEAGIIAVLHTLPGERVNNPEFGSNVRYLVFEQKSPALLAQLDSEVTEALTRWMGDVIEIDSFDFIESENVHELQYKLFFRIRGELGDARTVDVAFESV